MLAAGGTALAIAALITANREDIADAVLGDGVTTGVSTWGVGDALGGVLWSITLYFCTPWQLLLIFLGRVDTERPSDWLIAKVGRAAGYKYALAWHEKCPCSNVSSVKKCVTCRADCLQANV